MRNDEFNKIEITNDKQIRGLEFGKTQDSETISQKENKLPEGELNEKYVGKTIRKQTEVNVQYVNKATAPAHGSATVTSTTTASNIAATATTVVTAASVVATIKTKDQMVNHMKNMNAQTKKILTKKI